MSTETSNQIDYWHEVTDAINTLIKLTWPITRDRILKDKKDYTTDEQLFHLIEECVEYHKELMKAKYIKADWLKIDNENLDMLFAWLALQHVINQNAGIDKFAVMRTLQKFTDRGWLKFEH